MFEEVLWEMGHHYVPQRYLENFQDPNHPGFIWLHDKRAGVARLASIEKVAQVKGYYSEDTERYLAHEVETPANAVMKKLIDKTPITPAERAHMAYYIGVMLKRIPARHRHATEMIPSVLDDVVARIRRQLQETADAIRADPQVLARRLGEVNSETRLDPVVADVNPRNIETLIAGFSALLDATDNLETRFLINDACAKHGIPWVYGGAVGSTGLVLPIIPGRTACLRCILEELPAAGSLPTPLKPESGDGTYCRLR